MPHLVKLGELRTNESEAALRQIATTLDGAVNSVVDCWPWQAHAEGACYDISLVRMLANPF